MNIKEEAFVHNKFDVVVVDAVTGEEKQKAVGYNVICNRFFSALFGTLSTDGFMKYIAFGTGTGTPSITDNSLFTALGRASAETLEISYQYPTSYCTKRIKLGVTSYVDTYITEVGFESYYKGTWDTSYYLMTHAMLQDSEGNQIAIHKTDTDVVYITATFYCSYTPGGFGANGIYPTADKNKLITWVLERSYSFSNIRFYRYPLLYSSDLADINTGAKSGSNSGTGSTTTLRYDLPITTFLETEGNNCIIKHLGVPGVGAITFPDHDIFPPYKIDRIALGTGDGITKDYNIKCPLIMNGSEKVFLNNVEQIRGVDYTIDYENNCGDWDENYASGEFTCMDEGIILGNMKEKTVSSSTYYDPLACWKYRKANFFPANFLVTNDKPIYIDFKTAKDCNTFKLKYPIIPSVQIDNLVIEYSTDEITWNMVTTTRTEQVWKWDDISARYWRIYIPDYNWTFNLSNSYYQYIMLGKTKPGLSFINPPEDGASIDASYLIEYPFKTENNLLRFTYSIQLQRG